MRPKAENIFENYDLEVLRTWKVRGAILCEATQGFYILKEFSGQKEKLLLLNMFLTYLRQQGFLAAEELIPNKENELLYTDSDGMKYIVKKYVDYKECRADVVEDCKLAMKGLGCYHKIAAGFSEQAFPEGNLCDEFERHNRELKRVRKYLKEKGRKSSFEHYINQYFDLFLQQALEATDYLKSTKIAPNKIMCHGDFQYHNILMNQENYYLINFERCLKDSKTRDIYHFMRKCLEKNDWSLALAEQLLTAYEEENHITDEDFGQLRIRFMYPEKFWKIANYYYNSRKTFIPLKNQEKLEAILAHENKKKQFINKVL